MPVVEPFTTLGSGNGFVKCLSEFNSVDVLSNDVETGSPIKLWTTLSGFNNNYTGLPSAESVGESHRLAMLYFWNSYQLNAEAIINDQFNSIDVGTEVTPQNRVCPFDSDTNNSIVTNVGLDIELIAMYKGSKFIGYGIGGGFAYANINDSKESLAWFGSYTVEEDYENPGYELINTSLTTIALGDETLNIVSQTRVFDKSGSGGLVSNASELYAYDESAYTSSSIYSIDVYTYGTSSSFPSTFPITLN